jgi:anti-sigma B factor antagonist
LKHDTPSAAEKLEITVNHGNESFELRLSGRLGVDSSPELRTQLLAILRVQSPPAVSVDLSAISYIDASGIATLVEGLKAARHRGTTLCLQGLQGRVRHLFEVTGMLTLFEATSCGNDSPPTRVQ